MTGRIKILICLLMVSLLLRLYLNIQVYSGDLNNHMTWASQILDVGGENAYYQEYPGVMMPTYPPVSLLNFISSEWLYRQNISLANYLNTHFQVFPSRLIWFMQDSDYRPSFYKILNIASDLGIGLLIFKFTKSNLLTALFTLNPAVWYLSSLWGQIDYLPILFILLSYAYSSHFYFVLAWLSKQTAIILFPIFLIFSWKKLGFKKTILGMLLQLVIFSSLYALFTANPITTYLDRLNTGSGSVWINDNAFNLWVFVSQMRKVPDNAFRLSSLVIFAGFLMLVLIKYAKNINFKSLVWVSYLFSAGAFFILTRMHERYFAPALPFLLLLSYKNKKMLAIFLASTILHLLNLYHWWWFPNIPGLISFLSPIYNIQILSLLFTLVFLYSVYEYFQKTSS